ncbi:hypothetical protein [Escherichia coli]|uniref:hypothetical protein n=1 Tax=Escherichia coli TaxID=562 RepID=UPI000B2F9FF0|nr:hypothetical protein [Escherichia coli]
MKKMIIMGAIALTVCSSGVYAIPLGNTANAEGTTYITQQVDTTITVEGKNLTAPVQQDTAVYSVNATTIGGADAILVWTDDNYIDSNGNMLARDDNGKEWLVGFSDTDVTCNAGGTYSLVTSAEVGLSSKDNYIIKCTGNNNIASVNFDVRNQEQWPAGNYTLKMQAVGWTN